MIKGFNFIRNKNISRNLAIIFLLLGLIILTLEFVLDAVLVKFYYENLFAYLFELFFNVVLIIALFKKIPIMIEINLIVLKAFEGSYYPLRATQRIDQININNTSIFELINHIIFALSAFALLIALIYFCLYKINNKKNNWDIMKILLLISGIMMLISTISYVVYSLINSGNEWEEILQPGSMTSLIAGMLMACEYVEEETIYA